MNIINSRTRLAFRRTFSYWLMIHLILMIAINYILLISIIKSNMNSPTSRIAANFNAPKSKIAANNIAPLSITRDIYIAFTTVIRHTITANACIPITNKTPLPIASTNSHVTVISTYIFVSVLSAYTDGIED
jgi:hypothetical protein